MGDKKSLLKDILVTGWVTAIELFGRPEESEPEEFHHHHHHHHEHHHHHDHHHHNQYQQQQIQRQQMQRCKQQKTSTAAPVSKPIAKSTPQQKQQQRQRATNNGNPSSNTSQCSVCMSKPVDAVLINCGHMCLCYGCGIKVYHSSQKCPLCRKPIERVLKTYHS